MIDGNRIDSDRRPWRAIIEPQRVWNRFVPISDTPPLLTTSKNDWDQHVDTLRGDLLQYWDWGEFKRRSGWHVERVTSPSGALAQILFRRVGPFSLAYIPRGPVFPHDDAECLDLLARIDAACARHRATSVIIEPQRPLPGAWLTTSPPLVPAARAIQSSRTVIVDLRRDDDALIAGMRRDTRYNLTYAQRHGLVVERAPLTGDTLDEFFDLLSESAERAGFGIHERAYYRDFLDVLGDRAVVLFTRSGEDLTAGLIACQSSATARSMYAGKRPHPGSRGDAVLLRFTAMQWAREQGCTSYDLGGIARVDPVDGDEDGLAGVEKFKTGFGGTIVTFPPTVERHYRPNLARFGHKVREWLGRTTD